MEAEANKWILNRSWLKQSNFCSSLHPCPLEAPPSNWGCTLKEGWVKEAAEAPAGSRCGLGLVRFFCELLPVAHCCWPFRRCDVISGTCHLVPGGLRLTG